MITYVDTSTFLKLLIYEDGTQVAEELWYSGTQLSSSRLLRIEARSALAIGRRLGRVTRLRDAETSRMFEDLWARLIVVELTAQLSEQACELAETMELRALDAVHLASAIAVGATTMTSADRKLCVAAQTVGLRVISPLD